MLDFMYVSTRSSKKGQIEIYPRFRVVRSSDLMIRGGDFYAIWDESKKLWSTDEYEAVRIIDAELDKYANENANKFENPPKVLHLWDSETGMIDAWHRYCQRHVRDSFHMLDEQLIFSNTDTKKEDYASKKLNYPLEEGSCPAFDKLIGTLYSPEERHKLEWAIGSIVSGDSKRIQKFMVLYGAAGTGKSTILNIIQKLFEGYYSVFDARSLGSSSNSFALEAFKSNPLVAIQHDGDLSRIEDNTRLNSLVSHELMTVNEKFRSAYSNSFKCFLFMGTNKPVRITDGRSGLLRRLIDVAPSGNKVSQREYKQLCKQIDFELGAIAYKCLQVYLEDPNAYDDYLPINMLGATNDFYNFIVDSYYVFKTEDSTTLKSAWEMYKNYCEDAKVGYPMSQKAFKEELKNYFKEYHERVSSEDGKRLRSVYSKFRREKFEDNALDPVQMDEAENWLKLEDNNSIQGFKSVFDYSCQECKAQYATTKETPRAKWSEVTTTLDELDTSRLHYVMPPKDLIVIDFDLKDSSGNKSYVLNFEEASKWPPTYAETSKGGAGIHLHYFYSGDVSKLSSVYDEDIEIKVFTGNSSLRRKVTKCNMLPISILSSGLPLKGEKMVDSELVLTQRKIITMIKKNLNKEYHPSTRESINFISKILDNAYNSGIVYDVSVLKPAVLEFAESSTNQAATCVKMVAKMHFKSKDPEEEKPTEDGEEAPLFFYDTEIYPNVFFLNGKFAGPDAKMQRWINPSSEVIEQLLNYRLVDFNGRRYDRHLLYSRLCKRTVPELYDQSQRIINKDKTAMCREAYNLGYTDVYDFCSKKQSLKKWEIELGLKHMEMNLPWDEPVPEEMWPAVSAYCDNDVMATEAVFNARQGDFLARKILALLAGGTVNDTTNALTTKIVFGKDRNPQREFNYRDMGDISAIDPNAPVPEHLKDPYTQFDKNMRPIFPGYKHEKGRSTYRGEEVGEGGFAEGHPGMYGRSKTFDVASMHPSSAEAEDLFGPFTKNFSALKHARVAVKHKDYVKARNILFELLERLHGNEMARFIIEQIAVYLTDENAKSLAQALKIAINSMYGLTAASFSNPFRDDRNIDNIVAKRGALFMINLKNAVQDRGGQVIHIKTDSIKIVDPSAELEQFVLEYGKLYGYDFEVEHVFDRICLVNDAVYICKLAEDDEDEPGKWSATGTQFKVPYVFKFLFSKEKIEFEDMCETKSVSTALYLDMNENLGPDEHDYQFVGKVGRFCPIKPGCGGGELMRKTDTGYAYATGSTGYRWLPSDHVELYNKQDDIDISYYRKLVDDAIETISQYGDFEQFVYGEVGEWPPVDEPPWN